MMAGALRAKGCFAHELGVRGTLPGRFRVEGDEPVEKVEEIQHIAALRNSPNSCAFR
jgi:hypothetical protein